LELSSNLVVLESCHQNCMTYTNANVQWKTPDDGQRNCPERVDFIDKINLGN